MDILSSNTPQLKMNDEQLARFVESITLVDCGYSSQCWQWNKTVSAKGYGRLRIDGKKTMVHRASYEHFVSIVPEEYEVDHLCKNRACANPEHLEPVTHTVNVQRGEGIKGKHWQLKICRKGHSLVGDNVVCIRGARRCKICYQVGIVRKAERQRERLKERRHARIS